jgi:hypothetical protein
VLHPFQELDHPGEQGVVDPVGGTELTHDPRLHRAGNGGDAHVGEVAGECPDEDVEHHRGC